MLSNPALKLIAAAGLSALALSACGRRGALEPPQTTAPTKGSQVPAPGTANGARTLPDGIGLGGGSAKPASDAVRAGDELALSAVPPSGTEAPVETSRGAKRGYRIPKEPFLLDPLL